jgi:hypothetical protein
MPARPSSDDLFKPVGSGQRRYGWAEAVAGLESARTSIDIMRTLAAITIALLPSLAHTQPLPQPKPVGAGGSCPHGYTSSGSFCVPSQGAQDAIPLPPNGSCPHGWTRSGSFCLRSGSGR